MVDINRVMDMFNDEDDFMHSNPKEKFFDILFNANNDVVRHELDIIVQHFVAMESLLEKSYGENLDDEIQKEILENSEDNYQRSVSFYIEKMGEIVSKSE
jgi:hypothetical protein